MSPFRVATTQLTVDTERPTYGVVYLVNMATSRLLAVNWVDKRTLVNLLTAYVYDRTNVGEINTAVSRVGRLL